MREIEPKKIKIEGESGQPYETTINPDDTPDQLHVPPGPPPADLAHGE